LFNRRGLDSLTILTKFTRIYSELKTPRRLRD